MLNTCRKFLFSVTFVLLYHGNFAQNMVVKNLSTQRFLPSANLHHIVKDSEGYMWYATEDGLCRDNGYQVDVFRSDCAHPDYWGSNHVVALTVGTDGKIWVATETGLYYLDKTDYQIRKVKDNAIPHHKINNIGVTSDGSVWVMAERSLVRLTADGKVKKVYKATNAGDGKKFLNSIHEDSRGRYWLYECRGGICRYDATSDAFVPCRWDCPCEPHGGFYEDAAHGCFWVSTWGMGVVKYVVGTHDDAHRVEFQPCTYEGRTLDESKGKIISMSSDGKTLWCSAMDGFYAYDIQDDGSLMPHPTETLLPPGKKVFATTYVDAMKNIWVASYSPRTFILCRQEDDDIWHCAFPLVQAHTGMEMIAERAVEDVDGRVWLWHLRFGLTLWNPATDEYRIVMEKQQGVPGSGIMAQRAVGGVWNGVGTKVQVMWWEAGKVCIKEVVDVGHEVKCLLDDGMGHLWVGTSDGIYSYDMAAQQLKKRVALESGVIAIGWAGKRQELYFVAPQYGLGVVHAKQGKARKLSKDWTADFTALAVSPRGEVWTASGLGEVFFYDAAYNVFQRDEDASLTEGGRVMGMQVDSIGHLWVMANKCVKEYSPQWKTSRTYYADDAGFGLDYFLCMSHVRERVCVGGAGGLCLFAPTRQLDRHSRVRKPFFSSVVVDGRKHILGINEKEWVITPYDVSVAVHFSTLDHLNADRISYAYRFSHRGEENVPWTYLPQGQNTASFAALQQGDYVLEVKATDMYGNWGEEVASLTIVREPAWWETWWMRTLYVLLGTFIVASILYFYFRNRMQRMEIEKLVALAQQMRGQREEMAKESAQSRKDGQDSDAVPSTEDKKADHVERTLSKEEMKFLLMAKEHVERNIENPNYTTEQFASDMCMSRMSLYRKLQRTTGQSPTEFIRMMRLKEAARLLVGEECTVSEVVSRTGFATPSYFTKCFKEAFGVLPMEYRRRR